MENARHCVPFSACLPLRGGAEGGEGRGRRVYFPNGEIAGECDLASNHPGRNAHLLFCLKKRTRCVVQGQPWKMLVMESKKR